jgi:hypothetical protein
MMLMMAQLTYSVFWSKLVRLFPYWLGILATAITVAQAMGLWLIAPSLHPHASQMASFISAMLYTYGIHGVAAWNPPRKSLTEMSDDEREALFNKFPAVRDRWEAMNMVLNPEQVEALKKTLTPQQLKALLPAYA